MAPAAASRSWTLVLLPSLFLLAGCKESPRHYLTTVEIVQTQPFGRTAPGQPPTIMDLELRFVECPGDARKVMRGNREFTACGAKFRPGDKVQAEVFSSYNREREQYRPDIVRLGDCPVTLDHKDEANYESVEFCQDLRASGEVVGVHCDRGRSRELLDKCPWLRRK